jgi:DNA processing protein
VGEAERQRVLTSLGAAPASVDDIARGCGIAIHIVQAVVLELAIAGRIERHGAQLVSLSPTIGD